MWDFKRLPKTEFKEVKKLIKEKNGGKLLLIHDKYKLSNYNYCCGISTEYILVHFEDALKKGKLE